MERIKIELSRDLTERVVAAAKALGATPHAYVASVLGEHVPALESRDARFIDTGLAALTAYLGGLPSVRVMSSGKQGGHWWVKLSIDVASPAAWNVVQELGFVLNYISLGELLPTVFKPVYPPPYLNGGPREMLAWVIESTAPLVDPAGIKAVLAQRLPDPTDHSQWTLDRELGEDDDDRSE